MRKCLRKTWESQIPVTIKLAESEVAAFEQPAPLHLVVSRQSFLLNLVQSAYSLFQHLLPPGDNTPWFEYNNLPLKWSIPAGVLYDLLVLDNTLPWSLTLHFRNFPATTLPIYSNHNGQDALRFAYFNALKEAAYIFLGSADSVLRMSTGAQADLWKSITTNQDAAHYSTIIDSLHIGSKRVGDTSNDSSNIPLRLLIRKGLNPYVSSYEGIIYTSRPVSILNSNDDEKQQRTVLGALSHIDIAAKIERVIVCGIHVPLNTPLVWLYQRFHAPDCFLYMTVVLHDS